MRRLLVVALVAACGDAGDGAIDSGARDARAGGDAAAELDAPGHDAAPFVCDWSAPVAPPAEVLWAEPLRGTGVDTLGGHGHDDSFGAVGWCPGTRQVGQPYYRLIAAGFETDTDVTGDGDQDDALAVDFWRDPGSFVGVGESAGRVNIYLDIVDADGNVLDVTSNPEIRIRREVKDGPVDALPLTSKPANEFQTNLPMIGGGVRYAIEIEGASDRVLNLRLPVNHHVTYALVFRREP